MITVSVNIEGKALHNDLPLDRISEVLSAGKANLLWLDVVTPTEDELRLLAEEFAFHPLAIEDATMRHQRPKIDFYDGFLFLVFYEITLVDGRPESHEVSFFVGSNYLVTIHDEPCDAIGRITQRWRSHPDELGKRGAGFLVYSILDAIVDDYFPVVDALSDRIEALEERIFERADTRGQREVFGFRKDLTAIRRVLGPERDVMNILVRRDSPALGDDTVVYFQDVYDHILRVTDNLDTYRDLLGSALDSYLSVTSNRLNQVMKTLTASSIILMSMTLVASIYGMNFERIPELHWQFGYAWALGLMLIIGALLATLFKRIDWL
jgi:magnesium transporter